MSNQRVNTEANIVAQSLRRYRESLDLPKTAAKLRDIVAKARKTDVPDDVSFNDWLNAQICDVLQDVVYGAEDRAIAQRVYAIGRTPEECVRNLANGLELGEVARTDPLESGDDRYTWGLRFAAGGAGYKAAGHSLAGGVVCTWWK